VTSVPRDSFHAWIRPRECAAAVGLYALLTLVFAFPLTRHPASSVVQLSVPADTDLFVWTLDWDLHELRERPWSIFEANIYYPFHHTLAFSENLIGTAVIAAPVVWLSGNIILGMNAVIVLSCILCGLGAYVLSRRVGAQPVAAFLAGLIFAFAPTRFSRLGQVHLATIEWIPFSLAFLDAFLESGRARDLAWAAGFFVLEVLTSGHAGLFVLIAGAALVSWRTALGAFAWSTIWRRDVLLIAGAVLVVLALFVAPYRATQRDAGLVRSLGESVMYSPTGASFLASQTHLHTLLRSLLPLSLRPQNSAPFIFPGIVPLALALAALTLNFADAQTGSPRQRRWIGFSFLVEVSLVITVAATALVTLVDIIRGLVGVPRLFTTRELLLAGLACVTLAAIRLSTLAWVPLRFGARVRRLGAAFKPWAAKHREDSISFYGVLAVLFLWLSLGPSFVLYRLVYRLPGFNFIRVPSRFALIALLSVAVMAALGFDKLVRSLPSRRRTIIGVVVAGILCAEFLAAPIATTPFELKLPAIDRWLSTQPKPFVVAEEPVVVWSDREGTDRRHSLYVLHSIAHWQKTVHGYSGIRPMLHRKLYLDMLTFPDQQALNSLLSIGVTYVVVHPDLYPADEWRTVQDRLQRAEPWLTLEHAEEDGRVYSLHRAASSAK
jgi:hypothetical protein